MPDELPQEKPRSPGDQPDYETKHSPGKPAAGAQLQRRIDRNSEATEEAQKNPTGGAHSGSPDRSRP